MVRWTKKPPTRPGLFWAVLVDEPGFEQRRVRLVRVIVATYSASSGLAVLMHGDTTEQPLSKFAWWSDCNVQPPPAPTVQWRLYERAGGPLISSAPAASLAEARCEASRRFECGLHYGRFKIEDQKHVWFTVHDAEGLALEECTVSWLAPCAAEGARK